MLLPSQSEVEPQEPDNGTQITVTATSQDSLITDVTFGAELNVERADMLQADITLVQVDFKVTGETIDRTLMFQSDSYETGENTLGTTSSGYEIKYTYLSDVSAYQYFWTQNSVAISMTCKEEQTLSSMENFIDNFSFTVRSMF